MPRGYSGQKDTVLRLLREGKTYKEIAEQTGLARPTISYHATHNDLRRQGLRTYDWRKVQSFHDDGHGVRETIKHFAMSNGAWQKAKLRGDIVSRDHRMSITQLLSPGRQSSRAHVKQRLRLAGLLRQSCDRCGISDWLGEPLSLQLDHKNGIKNDNRLENLHLLCPNCHSQTDTFAGRNKLKTMPDGVKVASLALNEDRVRSSRTQAANLSN